MRPRLGYHLLYIGYGFSASLAVYYGLIWRNSLLVAFFWFHLMVCLGIPLLQGMWEGSIRENWRRLWEPKKRARGEAVFVGLVTGVPLFAAVLAGSWLLFQSGVEPSAVRMRLTAWGLAPEWLVPFAFYITVVNSFLEEWLWRGFMLDRLFFMWGRRQALLFSSGFYSLYHLLVASALFGQMWAILITGLIFLVGLLWGGLKLRYGTLYAPWLSHLLADLGLMVVLTKWIYS
ncbi:MAG: CPBP family intramembrane metalloprotease [Brevibacillus sp.]|nr:CPBP family intramembrane metalloprotease [Brevibacillus sp.]